MLTKLSKKINEMSIRAYLAAQNFRKNEAGDTNFISIMLILGIVVGIAVVFSQLSTDVVEKIKGIVNSFLDSLG